MPNKINASHILVKTDGEAYVALKEIREGKPFEAVAAEKSICPSRKKGGSLGWFGRGQMVKEFETAAFAGKKGTIIGPVKSQFGWHLIRIDDTA
jgi:peptidyl-prolyl cis-trans isomerase C